MSAKPVRHGLIYPIFSASCWLKWSVGLRWFLMMLLVAGLAGSARSQTPIFSEGFEGAFPGAWTTADLNPSGTPARWSDVDISFGSPYPNSGSWMGYCAGEGFAGTGFAPTYQSSMNGAMSRTVDLTGYTSATLTFWYNTPSIEEEYDYLALVVNDLEIWYDTYTTVDWQLVTLNMDAYAGGIHTISFRFNSDTSVQGEGSYLDDILLVASGNVPAPNLTPFQPGGWSDKIVVSKTTNTTTDSAGIDAGENLYVDWAVINDGDLPAPSFTTELYVDDVLKQSWPRSTPLPVNSYTFVSDYNIGPLSAGSHTIRVKTDSGGAVTETDEADNEYAKTIVVGGDPEIRIAPLSLDFDLAEQPPPPPMAATPRPAGDDLQALARKMHLANELAARLDNGEEEVRVIVSIERPEGEPRGAEWNSRPAIQRWQRMVKGRQDEILAGLDAGDIRLRHRFENQSGFSANVSRGGLEKLIQNPKVTVVEASRKLQHHLAQGIPLMNAAIYRSAYNGTGVAVAIVDTGVDYTHPKLGGGGFPNSKVIGGYDFGSNDSDPRPNGNAHGTACAGIAAGDLGSIGDYIGGVAPEAKIYALKVTDLAGGAFDDDIIAAWNWCVTHRNDDPANPLLVISTSFGGDRYFSACDAAQSAYATAANNAVAAGLTLVVSSGNEGYCDSLASPACISTVISVGAVYDAAYGMSTGCVEAESCAPKISQVLCPSGFETQHETGPDVVTRYSNTAGFLALLAPAHRAHTTDIVGGIGYALDDYATSFGGTSAACPYAAGGIAALQSAARATLGRFLTPAEVREKLISTGDLIADTKVAITTPRINLGRAIESFGQNRSFVIFNEGNDTLNVTSIVADVVSPWMVFEPMAPFAVPPGSAQVVTLALNAMLAPGGVTTRRLLIYSDDTNESPYPGGVFINVTNTAAALPMLHPTVGGDKIVLSWPANATSFVLESVDSLSGTWQQVMLTPTVVGGQKFVTNSLSDAGRFYRLRK